VPSPGLARGCGSVGCVRKTALGEVALIWGDGERHELGARRDRTGKKNIITVTARTPSPAHFKSQRLIWSMKDLSPPGSRTPRNVERSLRRAATSPSECFHVFGVEFKRQFIEYGLQASGEGWFSSTLQLTFAHFLSLCFAICSRIRLIDPTRYPLACSVTADPGIEISEHGPLYLHKSERLSPHKRG